MRARAHRICFSCGRRDGVAFHIEVKRVTTRRSGEEEQQETRISAWEGIVSRK